MPCLVLTKSCGLKSYYLLSHSHSPQLQSNDAGSAAAAASPVDVALDVTIIQFEDLWSRVSYSSAQWSQSISYGKMVQGGIVFRRNEWFMQAAEL